MTGALRINYAVYGNVAPHLHAHVIPRHATEPADMLTEAVWTYDATTFASRPFDADRDRPLQQAIAAALSDDA